MRNWAAAIRAAASMALRQLQEGPARSAPRMRILLVGAGAIGSTVAAAADSMPEISKVLVHDVRPDAARALVARCRKAALADDFGLALGECDLVVEAASQAAVAAVVPKALLAGKDVVVVSTGALADDALRAEIERVARSTHRRVHVPTGALAALDAVRAAREAPLARVALTTAKPPEGFGRRREDVPAAVTLYEGSAREAVVKYPKNVNVAAALALAGAGLDATRVRVVMDPALARNTHVVEAEGDFGSLRVEVRNVPSPTNPATSYLAALSVVALLRRLASPIQIGS